MENIFGNLISVWVDGFITLFTNEPFIYIFGSFVIFISLSALIKLIMSFK